MSVYSQTSWRDDIDALAFQPEGHHGTCVVHRLAFRTLMRLAHDPEKWVPVFGKGSCARKMLERDDDSPKSHPALMPTPDACIAYFAAHEGAFRASAQAKIGRKRLKPGINFHLTSRDLARALTTRALTVAK